MRRRLLRTSAFAVLISACVYAQNVFVLPAGTGTTSPTVFSADPLNQVAVLNGLGSGATYALAGPNGKSYIVSNTSNGTIQVTDSTFSKFTSVANLAGVIIAAMSPDAKKLVEVSSGGLVSVVDTTTDQLSVANVYFGGQIVDLAISVDSTRAYVLVTAAAGAQVAIADLKSGQAINTVPVPGTATGVSVAPTGLVYVSTQGAVYELDPNTFGVRYTINVTGRPGRLSFTPDGKTGIAVNQQPVNGTQAYVFDMATRTLTANIPQSSFPTGTVLDRILPAGNNRVFGYSSGSQALFDITLNPQVVTPFSFSSAGNVNALDISNTLPTPNTPSTQYLFFTSQNTLYRADLNSGQLTGQQPISGTAGVVSFAAPAITNGTPATIYTYDDNQSIAPNVASGPLVVKIVDASGHPLAGVGVSFGTNNTGVTFSTASAITDTLGNASTTVKGATSGPITVNVNASGLTATFTVNVGSTGGGGGGTGAPGLAIISGQGEIVPEQTRTSGQAGTSLVIQLTDQSGNPVASSNVVFTLQSGQGSICDPNNTAVACVGVTQSLTVLTSNCAANATGCKKGLASVDFLSTSVPTFPPAFTQAQITATAQNGSTVTFYISTIPQSEQAQIELHAPAFGVTLTAQSGQTLPAAIQAVANSGTGTAMPNVGMIILNANDPTKPAPAMCAGGVALSDPNGKISCDLVATAGPGNYQITVAVGNARSFTVPLVITPGVASKAAIVSGDKQSGNPGAKLSPLQIKVTDAAGNGMSGVSVSWTVAPSTGATLSNTSSVTDSQGNASTTPTLGNTTGTVTFQATAGNLPALTFTATITVPITGVQLVSGSGQSAPLNTAFAAPVVVKVVDSTGKGVSGIPVTFTANNGATVASGTVTSDSSGSASTTVTAGNAVGTVTVTAQSGSFSATATLTVVPPGPSNVVFLNGASFQQGVAPGAIVAIQGNGLLSGVQGIATPANIVGPLPTTFQGVTVTFNGTAAPIYSVSNVNNVQQVVIQVPYEVGTATSATVAITTSGGGSATISNVPIMPFSPGIFETTAFGQKQAVATHADGSYVSPSSPAARGENITVYLTGLGQTNPATGTNRAGVAGQNVLATIVGGINNAGVPVVSVQAVPGLIGVYALTLTVPADTQPGSAVPVQAIAYDAANNSYYAQGSVVPIQ